MRTLIYGMQSSGASIFTYFMGQNKNSVVIVDLQSKNKAPYFGCIQDVVLKCVINHLYTWGHQVRSFKPHKTILFLRNPFDNFISLYDKKWRNESGPIVYKFRQLEKEFLQRDKFDAVVNYEDFISCPEKNIQDLNNKGFIVNESFLKFNRTLEDMMKFNHKIAPKYCISTKQYYQRGKFSIGRMHLNDDYVLQEKYIKKSISEEQKSLVRDLCPSVCDYYGEKTND